MTTDILGEPYRCEAIDLGNDDEGPVVTTLVSRAADAPPGRAVLYVHGFNDYFFNTEYADWWVERGYHFYAVDLRKYGRSLRPDQTPNYVSDLREYFEDLDAVWGRITSRDGHDRVVATAHSTGGLTLPLWANEGPPGLVGMVLNSPWLDMHGPLLMRTAGTRLIKTVGARQPLRELPRTINTLYAQSLHRDHAGEWDYNLAWKSFDSWPVYAGWMSTVRRGHAAIHAGLDIPAPVLVLSSDRTFRPTELNDDVFSADIVLDVSQIRRWSVMLGKHVTYAAIPGGMHDLFLSRQSARRSAYQEVERWLRGYVD